MRAKYWWTFLSLLIINVIAHGQAWESRHGLAAAAYQAEFDKWSKQGYRLEMVSGYAVGNQSRYAAIFEKVGGPAWMTKHGLSGAEYQATVNKLVAQGYRPVLVSGYAVGNQDHYAAIFEKTANPPAWVAKHGLTGAEYQAEVNKLVAQGYRIIDVSGYAVGNQDHYAAIFEKTANAPAWVAKHGLTAAQYQAEFVKLLGQGYRLRKISGYGVGGQSHFAAIWEKSGSGHWQARHDLSFQQYQDEFDRLFYQGYRPVWVNGYTVGGQDRYAGIWEAKQTLASAELKAIDDLVADYMSKYGVPGLSFALTKDGRLVLAKTYGLADKDDNEKVAPRHRFRIASVSKPVTSVAVMKLLEQNKLKLSDKVFGAGSLLGTKYGKTPYKKNVDKITVQHLLEHTAGGWSNKKDDPMFSNSSMNHAELIGWTLDNLALVNAPGTNGDYSNFGFCVLGRVIEKVTGQSYEAYVTNAILKPCGITTMEIGGDKEGNRKANEVVYYGQGGENPYGMKVERMDSHGGWIARPIDLVRLLVHVDGFPTKADILQAATVKTMFTSSSVNKGYAKGWAVNTNNSWHNGSLPGEQAFLVRTGSGLCWAVLVNTRSKQEGFGGDLDKLMWNIVGKITVWPSFDLFD